MRILFIVVLAVFTQLAGAADRGAEKAATIQFVEAQYDADSGGFRADPKAKPGLRSTSAAVRALKYLGQPPTAAKREKIAAFVLACFDPRTGSFADAPGGKPDLNATAVGIMAAVELEIAKDKFAKAMDYLKANAKTFEDMRIGAAAVEAWGVKDCPFDLNEWQTLAAFHFTRVKEDKSDGRARDLASVTAMYSRLNWNKLTEMGKEIAAGQRADGGWGKKDEADSDLETTYRVMRALYLLKEKPKDGVKLREFLAKCRNSDGGSGMNHGDASSVGGVYFATIISHWLEELEKK